MARIGKTQKAILTKGSVDGMVIRYRATFVLDGENVSSAVRSLIARELMEDTYYTGGRVTAHITDAGRAARAETA